MFRRIFLLFILTSVAFAQSVTITEYPAMANDTPTGIVAGPDGALWFAEQVAGQIVRMTTAGTITNYYNIPTANCDPYALTAGSDGALWFLEQSGNKIGRITTAGAITEYSVPTANSYLMAIAAGPDGAVWFTETVGNKVGRITSAGIVTEYSIPTANGAPDGIAAGPDGAMWFAETGGNTIGRITTAGTVTEYRIPTANSSPYGITAGPDGAVWFAEVGSNKIGRITTSGVLAEYAIPTSNSVPYQIIVGPDGALWFTEVLGNKIGRITTSGIITEFPTPTASSAPRTITMGSDGSLWFTEEAAGLAQIGRLSVTAIPQTITFDAIPDQFLGVSPFPIMARSSSRLPIHIVSNTPLVCKSASGLVTLRGVGTCSITASQGGNANYNEATPVTRSFIVSLAKASNSFAAAVGSPIPAGIAPASVTVGDFNGDGIQDLAVGTWDNLTVLLGNGSGGFTEGPGSPFAVQSPSLSVAVGDFNCDGIQDLAVTSRNGEVSVLLGNGAGGFTPATGSPFAAGPVPFSVAVGDFNGDGIQDLAVANFKATDGGNTITVLLGNGLGGFTPGPGSPFSAGGGTTSIAVGDFNGDGIDDLAAANFYDFNVTVLLGNGLGGFTPAPGSPFPVSSTPNSIAVGDFNGDGIQDLVTADYSWTDVTLLLGNGLGGFAPAAGSPFTVGSCPSSLVVGDFNGDGNPDLAVANCIDNVTVLLGNGSGGLIAAPSGPSTAGTNINSIAVGDFNGDGILDIATANWASHDVSVLLGSYSGNTAQTITFGPLSNVTYGAAPITISASSTSNLAVSLASNTTSVCKIAGGTVTILQAGTCSITASQAGNATYAAAATVTQSFSVAQASQTIAFNPLPDQTLGSTPPAMSASASSGLAVTLTSNSAAVCTVSGVNVTLVAPGTCSITASQTGNVNYAAATPVTRSFAVTGQLPVILVAAPNIGGSFYGMCCNHQTSMAVQFTLPDAEFVTTITVVMMGPSIYDFALQNSLTGSITTLATAAVNAPAQGPNTGTMTVGATLPAGTYYLVATQDASSTLYVPGWWTSDGRMFVGSVANGEWGRGDGPTGAWSFESGKDGGFTYIAPMFIVNGFPPGLTSQTITFDAIPDQILGISPFPMAARATSGWSLTFVSNTPSICTSASLLVTILKAGTCSITASQGGYGSQAAAPSVTRNFTVSLAKVSNSFTAATGSPFAAGNGAGFVAVGEFNGDGFPDLAIANQSGNSVTILVGNGAGGFAPAAGSPVATGSQPAFVVVGDFNCDGIQDLAVANYGGKSITVLLGNGAGGFTPAAGSPFSVGTGPVSIAVGDFNGDGMQDLAIANKGSSSVTLLLGDGLGGFGIGGTFAAPFGAYSVAAGDFNGDGIQDIAIAGAKLTVLLGNRTGLPSAAPGSPLELPLMPTSLAVGDFNGDGIQDLAMGNTMGPAVTVLLGDGSGGFAQAPGSPFFVYAAPYGLVVGDFNGDGIRDLAASSTGSNGLTVLRGDGSGGFTAIAGGPFATGSVPSSVVVGDFNRDGIQDLAIANSGSSNVTVLLGFAAGPTTQSITLGPLSSVTLGAAPFAISATASSGLAVSVSSVTSYVCSVSSGKVTVTAVGTCAIVASQAGNATYAPAVTVTQSFTVNGAPQTITFAALSNQNLNSSPPALSATASSGLPVSFASTTTEVCTVSGTTVTLVSAGMCSITASQPGDSHYAAATPVIRTFTVLYTSSVQYLISTYAGVLPAAPTAATAINYPLPGVGGVAVDQFGNTYASSSSLNCVFKIDPSGVLTRVAGTCTAGYSGDGGPAVKAQLSQPDGLALDGAGNLYIADAANSVVRRVAPNGIITTVAGNGISGYSGDGSLAASAQLNVPTGVAVDSAGNLYVADFSNHVIRKVAPNGTISTLAGTGKCGHSGDGSAATGAQLCGPQGVAVDSAGNVYISDTNNNTIRKVVAGGTIFAIAGNGGYGYSGDGGAATAAQLRFPLGLSLDSAGNLYIADARNNVIREVSSSGIITTVAGTGAGGYSGDNGPATSAQLSDPGGVAIDSAGNLEIADNVNNRVRVVNQAGAITTLAGNGFTPSSGDGGQAALAQFSVFSALAVDATGSLYIGDPNAYVVRKVTPGGAIATIAGTGSCCNSGDGGPATSAAVKPSAMAVDSSGNLYIGSGARVRRIAPNGAITTIAGTGVSGFSGDKGPATSAQIGDSPLGLAVDSQGTLYISDLSNLRVRKVTPAGIISTVAGTGVFGYSGDGGPGTNARLVPAGLAVDAAGNLYIADYRNEVVRKLATDGTISTFAGTGVNGSSGDGGPAANAQLATPFSLAMDSAGNLYIGMWRAVRKVSSGIISTIAGTGIAGYSGDGGPALGAQLGQPNALAVDTSGRIYFGDAATSRVRVLQPTGTAPVLTVSLEHSGNFTFGQTDATYTLTVSNAASALPTNGMVTVSEVLPPGLTPVSMTGGDGWYCSNTVCINNGSLAAGASYVPITVTVSVAADAPPQAIAEAAVTGGGAFGAGATDLTNIGSITPVLQVASSHAGVFAQGQMNATYILTVGNQTAAAPTGSPVTVTETLPPGLTLVSMTGPGWGCTFNTCTRNDILQGGGRYPAITVIASVALDAPLSVTNLVGAAGGGSPDASVTDVTPVSFSPCDLRHASNIDVTDVQTIINQAMGAIAFANDLNGDGSVNIVDVQIEASSMFGMGCAAK